MDSDHNDTFGRAAELAYFFFLAVFPAAVFVLTLVGIVGTTKFDLRSALFNYAAQALPPSAWQMVQKTIDETLKSAKGWTLVVGLLGALWSASSGTSSLMTVLNFSYNIKESRPWWKTRFVIAILLTIALSALMLVALAIVLFGGWAAQFASTHGLGQAAVIAWKFLQVPFALFFVVIGFAALYYWGPDVEQKRWYWITPGSLVGVLLWVVASAGFRIYLHFFNTYSATYGSLGAVIILLLWFYITSLALLVGAEINASIEHAAAEHGRADAKLKGEREAPAA
jgi:membrane protein